MKIAKKIVRNLFFFFFFFFFFFLLKHAPSSTLICERRPEIGANPALYSNLWKEKVALAAVQLTTDKGQRRGYSQAVFWHNKDGSLCE